MPFILVETPHGPVNFRYALSTPLSDNADAVVEGVPTVVFLHPVYLGMEGFQTQFRDRRLRRFNLVTFDQLGHGETEGKVPKKYLQEESASDVIKLMEALKLPPCFVVGLSMGTITATQLAVSYPSQVLGLFLISPLCTEEPPDVAEGREEIYECWTEGIRQNDQEAILDAAYGILQLSINNAQSSLLAAFSARTLPIAIKNYGLDSFEMFHSVTVKFFTERKGYSREALSGLKSCPFHLVRGGSDVAYPKEYFEEFYEQLKEAKLDVGRTEVDGAPHFASLTHSTEINPILENFVESHWQGGAIPAHDLGDVTSPFDKMLQDAGWVMEDTELEDTI